MMIPPLVRIGPIPSTAQQGERFAVLHREFGWLIATKAAADGYFYRRDDHGQRAPLHNDNVLCWMPQDGS